MPFNNFQELGQAVSVLDEGILLTDGVSSIDFVGSGITATAIGGVVTATFTGGSTVGYSGILVDTENNPLANVSDGLITSVEQDLAMLLSEAGETLFSEADEVLLLETQPVTGDYMLLDN